MKKRLFAAFLCLLMLLPVLCACGETAVEEESTSATTGSPVASDDTLSSDDVVLTDWVPVNDYGIDGGLRPVTLLTCPDYNEGVVFFRWEASDEPLSASSFSRTSQLSEWYHVDFEVEELVDIRGALQSSIMGGGGDYDLVYPHPTVDVLSILSSGYYYNLCDFENIHLEQPWWNESQVYNYTIDGKLYMGVSDFSLGGQGFTGILFHRGIYEDLQLDEDLYDLVYSGKWTMDKLRQTAMLYGRDFNNDDIFDENDYYGMIYQRQTTAPFYWALGGRLINTDGYGNFALALNEDQASTIAGKLYNLAWENQNKIWVTPKDVYYAGFQGSIGWKAYKAEQALFMTYDIGGLYRYLMELTFKVGYLPCPMLEEGDPIYPTICAAGFFAIPRKCSDPEMSSILLEALSVLSYKDFRVAFFNNILLGRMSEQEEDYDMLVFLHENKVYDLGYTFNEGGAVELLHSMVIQSKSAQVSSYINGRQKTMKKMLQHIEDIRNGKYEAG